MHPSMPLLYWIEAFRTAAFLINLMPSKVIKMIHLCIAYLVLIQIMSSLNLLGVYVFRACIPIILTNWNFEVCHVFL